MSTIAERKKLFEQQNKQNEELAPPAPRGRANTVNVAPSIAARANFLGSPQPAAPRPRSRSKENPLGTEASTPPDASANSEKVNDSPVGRTSVSELRQKMFETSGGSASMGIKVTSDEPKETAPSGGIKGRIAGLGAGLAIPMALPGMARPRAATTIGSAPNLGDSGNLAPPVIEHPTLRRAKGDARRRPSTSSRFSAVDIPDELRLIREQHASGVVSEPAIPSQDMTMDQNEDLVKPSLDSRCEKTVPDTPMTEPTAFESNN